MKLNSRIAIYATFVVAGIYITATKIYHEFTNKTITTSLHESKSSAYRIGHFIGHFMFIGLGSLLFIAGIAGLMYTFKKFKNNAGDYN